MASDLDGLLSALRSSLPSARIFITSILALPDSAHPGFAATIAYYNSVTVPAAAAKHGAAFVDIAGATGMCYGPGSTLVNLCAVCNGPCGGFNPASCPPSGYSYCHPTAAGYSLMAGVWANALVPVLAELAALAAPRTAAAALPASLPRARAPPAPLPPAVVAERARAALVGGLLADAAAMPLHWIYSVSEIAGLVGSGEPEFFSPPSCPFYSYPPGDSTPYGQQLLAYLRVGAATGAFAPTAVEAAYAALYAAAPAYYYKDASTKEFLANERAGKTWPSCGGDDNQADALVHALPVVALLGGLGDTPRMLAAVEDVVRVTQDTDEGAAFGLAGARLMEYVIGYNYTGVAALSATIADLTDPSRASPYAQDAALAAGLQDALDALGVSNMDYVARVGQSCDYPFNLYTGAHLIAQLVAGGAGGGGSAAYVNGTRQTIMAGGDSGSRNVFVGACTAAAAGSVAAAVPPGWPARATEYAEAAPLIDAIVAARPAPRSRSAAAPRAAAAPGGALTWTPLVPAGFADAVCNDGSSAGYYFRRGSSSSDWLVFLEGGGWGWDKQSMADRFAKSPDLVSSKNYPASVSLKGIFASSEAHLAAMNVAFVKYCTSDAHSGSTSTSPLGYPFRGHDVLTAVFAHLVAARGLGGAPGTRVLFGGASAGARGALFNLDRVAALLPTLVAAPGNVQRVGGLLDSAFWVVQQPLAPGVVPFMTQAAAVVAAANASASEASACVAAYPGELWKCLYGVFAVPFVRSDFFIYSFQYDEFQLSSDEKVGVPTTAAQLAYAEQFRNLTRAGLARDVVGQNGPGKNAGLFPACYKHTNTMGSTFASMTTAGVSFEAALVAWWWETGAAVPQYVTEDCAGLNCGTTCPPV